jgi:hypothetical protein
MKIQRIAATIPLNDLHFADAVDISKYTDGLNVYIRNMFSMGTSMMVTQQSDDFFSGEAMEPWRVSEPEQKKTAMPAIHEYEINKPDCWL